MVGGSKKDRARLSSVVPVTEKGKRHKLKHRRFGLNNWRYIFTVRVPVHWHRL